MTKRKKKFSKAEIKNMNATPGLLSRRYLPGEDRAQIRRLTSDPSSRKDYFAKRVTRRIETDEERSE